MEKKNSEKKMKLPLYPVFIKDPYFSIWIRKELKQIKFYTWWGKEIKIFAFLEFNNKKYSFLSDDNTAQYVDCENIDIDVSSTKLTFITDKFTFIIKFVSLLPLDNLEVLSCPVCEINYNIDSNERILKSKFTFMLGQEICYNSTEYQNVRGYSEKRNDGFSYSLFGKDEQQYLSNSCDKTGADWGYYIISAECSGYCVLEDNAVKSQKISEYGKKDKYKVIYGTNELSEEKKQGIIYIGFDDITSINYYGNFLKGYYFKDGKTIFDAIDFYRTNQSNMNLIAENLNEKIIDCAKDYGKEYEFLLSASYRQAVGAHKLVESLEGEILFLSKECSSAGCISTVDVSFPSMPLFLKFNPSLIKGMITPIFKFAEFPVWKYNFAPHDAGVYPHCTGQWYGIDKNKIQSSYYNEGSGVLLSTYEFEGNKELYDFNMQMPVEECGNMLILTALADKYNPDDEYLKRHFDLLEKWAKYLFNVGMIPKSQLCTDDFAGHLDKNINLSIKSIIGLKSFSVICERLNKGKESKEYYSIAKNRADKLMEYRNFGYLPLTFGGKSGEYSLKYNLFIDKLLGNQLFSDDYISSEIKEYSNHINKFGVPLDYRANYGKTDWMMWTAAIDKEGDYANKIIKCICDFLNESEEKVAFSDWYDTNNGDLPIPKFRNRSVQGALFSLCLIKKGD